LIAAGIIAIGLAFMVLVYLLEVLPEWWLNLLQAIHGHDAGWYAVDL